MQTHALGNILRVVKLAMTTYGFTDENGFFIRVETSGWVKYCPMNNQDSEYIVKWFEASDIFVDPELCRRIWASSGKVVTPQADAADFYVGYGV